MPWEKKKPSFGDQIRVNRGLYFHHGIYIDDNNVIQFGSMNGELDPDKARVIKTSLSDFLKGDQDYEVRSFTPEELAKKRSPEEIVNYAFLQLGRGGYNIISNNCEHFANECVFGKADSEQVDKVADILSNLFR